MQTCPTCDRPLERADDFWYCDNPDCPARSAAPQREEPEAEQSREESGSKPSKPAET